MMTEQQARQQEIKNYGSKVSFNANWKGPLDAEEREVTDVKFLIAYIAYMFFWLVVAIQAYSQVNFKNVEILKYDDAYPVLKDLYEIWDDENYSQIRIKMIFIIFLCVTLSGILSLSTIFLIRWWTQVIAWIIVFIFCLFFFIKAYDSISKLVAAIKLSHPDPTEYIFYSLFHVCIVILVIALSIIFYKRLNAAAEVVKEGSKAATYFRLLYLFSIIESAFNSFMGIVSGLIAGALLLVGFSTPEKLSNGFYVFQFYNIFGFFWTMNFIFAINQMTKSRSFATWYWSSQKTIASNDTVYTSLKIAGRYHLGTAALGSMILTICQGMKAVIDTKRKILEGKLNYSGAYWFECCNYVFEELELLVKYVNDYSYIICSIHGKKFVHASKFAFNLIMRSIPFFFLSNWLITSIVFASQGLSVAISSWVSYSLIRSENDDTVTSIVTLTVFFLAMIVSSSFFSVLKTAVETVYLCILEDLERNDGSPGKPYFMSEQMQMLMRNQ